MILREEKLREAHRLPLLAEAVDVVAKGSRSQQKLHGKAGLSSLVSFQALLLTHCGNAQADSQACHDE